MLLGYAEKRELVDFGASWSRRLILNRVVNWQYSVELLPVALESDPTAKELIQYTEPITQTLNADYPPGLGFRTPNDKYRHRHRAEWRTIQVYRDFFLLRAQMDDRRGHVADWIPMEFHAAEKRQPVPDRAWRRSSLHERIPIAAAGSFNFTFDVGAGFELYRSRTRSIRAEYRYHHISNQRRPRRIPDRQRAIPGQLLLRALIALARRVIPEFPRLEARLTVNGRSSRSGPSVR